MKVESTIQIYEVDGKEVGVGTHPKPTMKAETHWSKVHLLVLRIDDKSYAVRVSDIAHAVENVKSAPRGARGEE